MELKHGDTKRAVNQRGQRSREEILEAAARIMGERGYGATSVADLSNEIGLAKSVIFHHFHTKQGLLSAVMERGLNDFFEAMRVAHLNPPDGGTPRERLRWFLERAAAVLTEREEFLRLHMFLILSADVAEVAETIKNVRRDGQRHVNHMIFESFREEGPEIAQAIADRLDRFGLAGIDGAFLAGQADSGRSLSEEMGPLASGIALMGEQLAAGLRSAGNARAYAGDAGASGAGQ